MPVEPCQTTVDGERRPGRRWGGPEAGTCYPCNADGDCAEAERKAKRQGRAIEAEARVRAVTGNNQRGRR